MTPYNPMHKKLGNLNQYENINYIDIADQYENINYIAIADQLQIPLIDVVNASIEKLVEIHNTSPSPGYISYINIDNLRFLLSINPDIDPKIILTEAILHGDTSLVKLALESKIDINQDNNSFLRLACLINPNNIAIIKVLLDYGIIVPKNILSYGNIYNTELLCRFINLGADVNSGINNIEPPLLYAVRSQNLPAIKILLEHGANANHNDTIRTCVFDDDVKILKLLVEYGAQLTDPELLLIAIKNMSIEMTKFLIDNGVNVNINIQIDPEIKQYIQYLVSIDINPIDIAQIYALQLFG